MTTRAPEQYAAPGATGQLDASSVPGVLLVVFGTGVLLTGESGSGKSELALSLLDRGHRLVADDVVDLSMDGEHILGRAPAALRGYLELRGLGLCPVDRMYGERALQEEARIDHILRLERIRPTEWAAWPRLEPRRRGLRLLGIDREAIVLPVTGERPLGPLVEMVVRMQGRPNQGGHDP